MERQGEVDHEDDLEEDCEGEREDDHESDDSGSDISYLPSFELLTQLADELETLNEDELMKMAEKYSESLEGEEEGEEEEEEEGRESSNEDDYETIDEEEEEDAAEGGFLECESPGDLIRMLKKAKQPITGRLNPQEFIKMLFFENDKNKLDEYQYEEVLEKLDHPLVKMVDALREKHDEHIRRGDFSEVHKEVMAEIKEMMEEEMLEEKERWEKRRIRRMYF